jgi:ABC-2 type transport system ATP-binding protein
MEEAELLADRVAIIDEGRIKAIDTPRNLISRLDGQGHIEFAATASIDVAELTGLAGVRAVTNSGDGSITPNYRMEVTEPRTAVTSLLDWSKDRDLDLRGLEVVPGTLEDVFLSLTGRELRE